MPIVKLPSVSPHSVTVTSRDELFKVIDLFLGDLLSSNRLNIPTFEVRAFLGSGLGPFTVSADKKFRQPKHLKRIREIKKLFEA